MSSSISSPFSSSPQFLMLQYYPDHLFFLLLEFECVHVGTRWRREGLTVPCEPTASFNSEASTGTASDSSIITELLKKKRDFAPWNTTRNEHSSNMIIDGIKSQ